MDWKKQFKFHGLGFRNTCIVLLLLVFNLLILVQADFRQVNPDAVSAAYHANCASKQRQIYKLMCEVSGEEGFELQPDWTVADLIRAAVRKDFQKKIQTHQPHTGESVAEMGHRLEKEYFCRNIRYERAVLNLRRKRKDIVQPYLVFPVSASAMLGDSLQPPVPILMCPPGAHGDKRGSIVLYSDGNVEKLTAEEAEKLVAEQSPVPLKIVFEAKPEEGGESQ